MEARECLEARLALLVVTEGVLRFLFEVMSVSASKQVRRHEHGLEQCCMPHVSAPCWGAYPLSRSVGVLGCWIGPEGTRQ